MSRPAPARSPWKAPSAAIVADGWVLARARVNIALIKYWGKAPAKSPDEANLPAVPSLSLTLDGLHTDTLARFAPELDKDRIVLGGKELDGEERARAVQLLDVLRRRSDVASPFLVHSANAVPTAAGLASSASGMAALAVACGRFVGLDPEDATDQKALSELARIGSGSASRSIFGGWVAWDGPAARPLAPAREPGPPDTGLDVAVVVAVVTRERKPIGSRDGMNRTQRTSPFFAGWVEQAHATFHEALAAVTARDLPTLIHLMERSTWRMHASAMGADPPVFYWFPASLAVLQEVDALKREGVLCGATLDAGPNVKIFCRPRDAQTIALRLTTIPGVAHTIQAAPGDRAVSRIIRLPEELDVPDATDLSRLWDRNEGPPGEPPRPEQPTTPQALVLDGRGR